MPVLVRIALRNMREHIAKSVIIGVLVALGVIVLVLGNAMMDAAAEGTRETFIDNFTGDVMFHGPSKAAVSIFGVQSMSMDSDTTVPTIPEFERTLELVRQDPRTEKASGMAVAYALLSVDAEETIADAAMENEDNDGPPFAIIFGVDPDNYYDMFPSLKIVEGRKPLPGEPAIVIQKSQLESLAKRYKRTFVVGDKILLSGFGTAGFKIREVVIAGVYERASEQSGPMQMVYTDIDTARVLGGLTLGADETVKLDATQTSLLDTDDLDALFGDDMVESVADSDKALDPSKFAGMLGDSTERERLNAADVGAWHFILVRLKDSGSAPGYIADLTKSLGAEKIDARVVDWKAAAGSFASFSDIVRIIFNIAIIIIAVVAVIVMMNTLVVSVIERTGEIGTMRALGAQKGFVRSMFLTETLTITLVFGAIGSVLAIGIALIVNALRIEAGNDLLKLLFGGPTLKLSLRAVSFAFTLVMVFFVGWAAHLYPVAVALRIPPVKAMQVD